MFQFVEFIILENFKKYANTHNQLSLIIESNDQNHPLHFYLNLKSACSKVFYNFLKQRLKQFYSISGFHIVTRSNQFTTIYYPPAGILLLQAIRIVFYFPTEKNYVFQQGIFIQSNSECFASISVAGKTYNKTKENILEQLVQCLMWTTGHRDLRGNRR